MLDEAANWFSLQDGAYERLQPDTQGLLQSKIFPGLWLDHAALLWGDLARVLEVVQQGLTSPEHAAFVARLSHTTQR